MTLSRQHVPQLNRLYRLQFEQAQDAWVLLYPEGMITLNPSASEILQLVNGERNVQDIIALLTAKFADAEGIDQDIQAFLEHAQERQWIVFVGK